MIARDLLSATFVRAARLPDGLDLCSADQDCVWYLPDGDGDAWWIWNPDGWGLDPGGPTEATARERAVTIAVAVSQVRYVKAGGNPRDLG